jgi:hypothetical protein
MPSLSLTRADIERLPNFRRKTHGEYSAGCPACGGEDRFIFWPDDGGYWCRQCNLKGFISTNGSSGPDWQRIALAEAARRAAAERDANVALAEVAKLSPTVAKYHANLLDPEKRAIWHTWGLTDESIDSRHLGYCFACPTCRESDSLAIPYYHHGKIVSIRHRLLHPLVDGGKYRPQFRGLPAALFNADVLDGELDFVLLVEGEIKALVLAQYGFPTVAVPGIATFKAEWLPMFQGVRVVVIPDPSAESQGHAIAGDLGSAASVLTLDCKPDDWFVVHGRSVEEFQARVDTALQGTSVKSTQDIYTLLDAIGEEEKPDEQDLYTLLAQAAEDDDSDSNWANLRRQKRLAMCGLWFFKPNPRTRRGKWVPYACGLPECKSCQRRRVERIKLRITSAAREQQVYALTTPIGGDKGLARKLNASGVVYSRHPSEDGSVKYIIIGQQIEGSEPFDVNALTDEQWEELARTPRGKNVSGSLMKAVPAPASADADPGEKKEIVFEAVHIKGLPQETTEQVWEQAVFNTADLTPTIDTLEACLKVTVKEFKTIAAQAGHVTFSVYHKEMIGENEVDWEPYNSYIREKLQRREAVALPQPSLTYATDPEDPF